MLDSDVLVLNRLWQPINVTTVRRAVGLLYLGRVKALDEAYAAHDWEAWIEASDNGFGDGEMIRATTLRLRVPRVVQLLFYDRLPHANVKFTRANIYLRDRHRCQYCGRRGSEDDLNIDHLIPRSRGGASSWENVVVACIDCNRRKGDRLPEEAGMQPLRPPRKPRWHPLLNLGLTHDPHPAWRPFLEFALPRGG